jgi:hypothetical protein
MSGTGSYRLVDRPQPGPGEIQYLITRTMSKGVIFYFFCSLIHFPWNNNVKTTDVRR